MDSNHSHSDDTDAAVLAPSPEYLICLAELSPANLKLYNTETEHFVRVTPSDQEFEMEHRAGPEQPWEHQSTGTDLKEIVREATDVLDLAVATKTCPQTGLEDLYIDTGEDGRLLIDDRDQFPVHIVKKHPNPFDPTNEEFLIEAPSKQGDSIPDRYSYHVHTRHCIEDEWEALHSCYEELTPAAAMDRFSAITDLDTLMLDEEEEPTELFQEPHETEAESPNTES
jgi:hypothetical protein